MKADSTLSKDEAELLVKFTALATMSSHDLAQGMKTLAKTVKPKHAFAEGIDIDDYHGKNTGDPLDDIAVFKDRHDLPETVQKIGPNYPRNAEYAGKVYHAGDLPSYENILKDKASFIGEFDFHNYGVLIEEHAKTFTGHKYKTYSLKEDIVVYRAGSKNFPLGDYFSFERPISEIQVRIDKAIRHQWPDGQLSTIDTVYEIKIPKGADIHIGDIKNQGEFYFGGTEQIIIPGAKNIQGIKIIKSYPLNK